MSLFGRRFPHHYTLSTLPVCLTQHAADFVNLVRSIFSFHLCRNRLVFMYHQNILNQIKACDFWFVLLAASRVLVGFFNDSLGYMQLCCGILCFQEMLFVGAGNIPEVWVRWQGSVPPVPLRCCGPKYGGQFSETEQLKAWELVWDIIFRAASQLGGLLRHV